MSIRVNPNYYQETVSSLYSSQKNENTALQQLSTSKRVNTPSDDPGAAGLNVGVQDALSANDQYTSNATTVVDRMQTADSALNSATTLLSQAMSYAVQGENSTLSDSNRQTLAQDVQQIQSQVLDLANTSYQGSYIFGGTDSADKPFAADSSGNVTYEGNGDTNTVQISNGLSVQTNLPGNQLFSNAGDSSATASVDVFGALSDLSSALESGDSDSIGTALTSLKSAYDYLNGQRTFYGNTEKQVQSTETFLSTDKVNLSQQQDDLIGADLDTACTNLEQAEQARQAVLSASSKISQSNLFNYLS